MGTAAMTETSPRFKARITGVLYLLTMLTGIFAQGFVSGRLVVDGDAAATATNILTHGFLLELGFTVYLKKMVRGLAHYHCGAIMSDKRVGVTHEPFPLFNELYGTLTTVYAVPHVLTGRSLFSTKPEVARWLSMWVL